MASISQQFASWFNQRQNGRSSDDVHGLFLLFMCLTDIMKGALCDEPCRDVVVWLIAFMNCVYGRSTIPGTRVDKNLAIANRSRVSGAHNTSMVSIGLITHDLEICVNGHSRLLKNGTI